MPKDSLPGGRGSKKMEDMLVIISSNKESTSRVQILLPRGMQ